MNTKLSMKKMNKIGYIIRDCIMFSKKKENKRKKKKTQKSQKTLYVLLTSFGQPFLMFGYSIISHNVFIQNETFTVYDTQ